MDDSVNGDDQSEDGQSTEFQPEFLARMLTRLDYQALLLALRQVC
jgi:hypothetical protein